MIYFEIKGRSHKNMMGNSMRDDIGKKEEKIEEKNFSNRKSVTKEGAFLRLPRFTEQG